MKCNNRKDEQKWQYTICILTQVIYFTFIMHAIVVFMIKPARTELNLFVQDCSYTPIN